MISKSWRCGKNSNYFRFGNYDLIEQGVLYTKFTRRDNTAVKYDLRLKQAILFDDILITVLYSSMVM